MYLLALDQGTTSSRALILNTKGEVLSVVQKEFKQSFPKIGYVEQDPEEIWSSQYGVANEAIAKLKIKSSEIAAIGITNQRETTILWDRNTSKPIYPAIVWQDRRTTSLCESLKHLETAFNQKTGLLLDPYFSGTKIKWILDNVPGAREKAARGELAFGTVDSWLVWKLTNGKVHVTDVSNASRTLLFNIYTLQWDEEILDWLDIPRSILPEVRSSSEVYGKTAPSIFMAQIPIGGIAGDQQAALFGQNCYEESLAKATYGTGCFLLMNTGTKPIISKHKLLTTIAWKIGSTTHYALEGSVFTAGAAIQWLRDNLGLIQKSSDIDALANSVVDTGGVYFVPAFTGLGAPHWAPNARGAIFGLTRGTTRAHIARAVLESIAHSAEDVLIAMEKDSKMKIRELHVDGGVVVSDVLMQMQANLSQIPILRPMNKELTALGAAMLAGLAVKIWNEPKECFSAWTLDRKFLPTISREKREECLKNWNLAIELTKNWKIDESR